MKSFAVAINMTLTESIKEPNLNSQSNTRGNEELPRGNHQGESPQFERKQKMKEGRHNEADIMQETIRSSFPCS